MGFVKALGAYAMEWPSWISTPPTPVLDVSVLTVVGLFTSK